MTEQSSSNIFVLIWIYGLQIAIGSLYYLVIKLLFSKMMKLRKEQMIFE